MKQCVVGNGLKRLEGMSWDVKAFWEPPFAANDGSIRRCDQYRPLATDDGTRNAKARGLMEAARDLRCEAKYVRVTTSTTYLGTTSSMNEMCVSRANGNLLTEASSTRQRGVMTGWSRQKGRDGRVRELGTRTGEMRIESSCTGKPFSMRESRQALVYSYRGG